MVSQTVISSIIKADNMSKLPIINEESILEHIYFIRGNKVMLDTDLADLYGVKTKRLNEQVK
jgi:hypothetical protein